MSKAEAWAMWEMAFERCKKANAAAIAARDSQDTGVERGHLYDEAALQIEAAVVAVERAGHATSRMACSVWEQVNGNSRSEKNE